MKALATGVLLAGLWVAGTPGRPGLPPLPPGCPVRVEVRGAEHRDALVCAADLPSVLRAVGARAAAPDGLRDGDRLEVDARGQVTRGRMAGPALRLLRLPIDINGASVEDLEALPGIGPTLAARLVAGRPYRSIGDLSAVVGIGPRRVEALVPAVEKLAGDEAGGRMEGEAR